MRHPTEIQIAFTTPTRPVVLRNGEKANERSVGAVVLLIREQMPKIAPRIAPADGPKRIAPMITGMCTVVALIIGSWIIPSGVLARRMTIAAISATLTRYRVSFFIVKILLKNMDISSRAKEKQELFCVHLLLGS